MKGLTSHALPWKKMTSKQAASQVNTETPDDSYDHMRAIDTKTQKVKPRTVSLADFNRTQARDDKLLRTSEAYANVILENSREEREVEIKANKEIQKKYMNMVNL